MTDTAQTERVDSSTPETAPPASLEMQLILQLTQTIDQLNNRVQFLSRQLNERVDYMVDQTDAHQQILGQICEAIHLHPTITPRVIGAEVEFYTDDTLPEGFQPSLYVTLHSPRHPVHGDLEIMMTDGSGHSKFVTIDQLHPRVASALLAKIKETNPPTGIGYHVGVGLLTKRPMDQNSISVPANETGTLNQALETLREQHAQPVADPDPSVND